MKKTGVLIFSIATGDYRWTFERCLRSQRAYARRNGYNYRLVDNFPTDLEPNEAAWLKIPLLIAALEEGWERVVYVDADCEVRKTCPPIDTIGEPGKSFFMAKGFSGRYNAGLIVVEKNLEALELLRTILANSEETVPREDQAPYENGHVIHYAKSAPCVTELHHTWNNNRDFDPESFIQHYSSGPLRKMYRRRLETKVRRTLFRLWERLRPRREVRHSSHEDGAIAERLASTVDYCRRRYLKVENAQRVGT